ncbi:MAG: ribonuclease III [Rhizobiales bacterium]|nr:ribonuclease III [Hyphomicrobiales bacterium]
MTRNNTGGVRGVNYAPLEKALGHVFSDRELLSRALTHSSAADTQRGMPTNERLEFLGDRVLGLVVAEWLSEDYAVAEEGELAVRLNSLVRKEACAEVAHRIGVGPFLRLGPGEVNAGGREKPAILADACEALIAALYLDGGLDVARRFIRAEWTGGMSLPIPRLIDAKTALQEWSQSHGKGVPSYVMRERSGPDHAPIFEVEVRVSGMKGSLGQGASKRQAEQAAARMMLIALGEWSEDD